MEKSGLLLSILLLLSMTAAGFSVSVEDSCSDSQPILSISNLTDAHAAESDYYQGYTGPGNQQGKQICMDGLSYARLRNSCTEVETPVISLSNMTNAHVGEPGYYQGYTGPGGQNGKQLCMNGVSNTYIRESCEDHETSLFSLSARQDAHIGVPGHYQYQVCVAEAQNIALELRWEHENSEVYVNSEQQDTGGTVGENDGLNYITTENSSLGQEIMLGLVNYGSFRQMDYQISGDSIEVRMVQDLPSENKASFLIPFTEGTHADIDQREQNIKGGLFSNPDFFEYSNPSFAYGMTKKKIIQATISYPEEKIDINGFTPEIRGSQVVYIRNMGEKPEGGKKLNISR